MISLLLTLAGLMTLHPVDAVSYDYPAHVATSTYTDTTGLHTCTGHLSFTYDGSTATIVADRCEPIFKDGFEK